MLTTWCLLLGLALPVLGYQVSVNCPHGRVCQRAFLSGNTILLHCNATGAKWYHVFMQKNGDWIPSTYSPPNMHMTPEGNLIITNPLPSQTGIYHCRNKNDTQVVQYEIDFQDVSKLHVTHKDLGQLPLENESLSLDHNELIFTYWEPWQDCNKCGTPGERKRVGYCYIQMPPENPAPCWLYLGAVDVWTNRMRPELQVESCHTQCEPGSFFQVNFAMFDSYSFSEETESVQLTCPMASVYRPVIWEVNEVPLTLKDQLSGKDFSTFLDLETGGQQLKIFKPAVCKCFVNQQFIARFNPLSNQAALEASKIQAEEDVSPTLPHSALSMLLLMLLTCCVVTLLGLLLKLLCPLQGKRSYETLLVR